MEERSRAALLAARFRSIRSDDASWSTTFERHHAVADETFAQLRSAVVRYTALLRDLGEPPERVVILVKELASEVTCECDINDPETNEILRGEFVRWTIDAYYAGADARR